MGDSAANDFRKVSGLMMVLAGAWGDGFEGLGFGVGRRSSTTNNFVLGLGPAWPNG